jgi:hypothetical protein
MEMPHLPMEMPRLPREMRNLHREISKFRDMRHYSSDPATILLKGVIWDPLRLPTVAIMNTFRAIQEDYLTYGCTSNGGPPVHRHRCISSYIVFHILIPQGLR